MSPSHISMAFPPRIASKFLSINSEIKHPRTAKRGDEVAEWLRRWTANPLCSARVGSNPTLVGAGLLKQDVHTDTLYFMIPI